MVIPTVGIVVSEDDRGAVPEGRLFERVHDVHHKRLLVQGIRVAGMRILIGRGFQEAYRCQIPRLQRIEEVVDVVLMVCRIAVNPMFATLVGRVCARFCVLA